MSQTRHAMQRRSFLGLGMAGGISLLSASLLSTARAATGKAEAKNVLVDLEQSGMSHVDTWNPKTEALAGKPIAELF